MPVKLHETKATPIPYFAFYHADMKCMSYNLVNPCVLGSHTEFPLWSVSAACGHSSMG